MIPIKYPIGDSSFRKIREDGFFYIDKTAQVYRLAHQATYCFLSRPRRFGKSLLISTLEAYFKGERELFDGLAMANMEKNWESYAVLRLDLSAGDMTSPENLEALLSNRISYWEDDYGSRVTETTLGERFSGIIRRAYTQTGHGVVILIDEYDNPLISTLHYPHLHERMRTILKGIYSIFKAESECIRFCFLTGITRFSKMSIFSGLNNLKDLTLDTEYATICGITQQELESECADGIRKVAAFSGWDYDRALEELKAMYDGYHFAAGSPDIYNPFSLLQALQSGDIQPYWNESGGRAEFLWRTISRLSDIEPIRETLSPILRRDQLGASENIHSDLTPLLFQTGYLTIKGGDRYGRTFRLGVPNREVLEGIMYGLIPFASRCDERHLTSDLYRLQTLAETGEVDAMMHYLQSFLSGVGSRLTKKMPEIYYENNLYILFTLIGVKVSVEVETSDGRMDVLMECHDYIYVIELKLDCSAEEAFEQIRHKHYTLPFERRGIPVIIVGINFSSQTRNIEAWKWERLDR